MVKAVRAAVKDQWGKTVLDYYRYLYGIKGPQVKVCARGMRHALFRIVNQ